MDSRDWEKLYVEVVHRLLLVAMPEAACRVLQDSSHTKMLIDEHQVDVPALYFKQQSHSDLPYFAETMRQVRRSGSLQLARTLSSSIGRYRISIGQY